jgi:hypothetical protein
MKFWIREVQPIFYFIMLSLCHAIQCPVVRRLVNDDCQKAIMTIFHSGFAFTDWGNHIKKKSQSSMRPG